MGLKVAGFDGTGQRDPEVMKTDIFKLFINRNHQQYDISTIQITIKLYAITSGAK